MILMCLVSVSVDDHVQVPAGTFTVSPGDAEFMAAWTSACEQLAAFIVFWQEPPTQHMLEQSELSWKEPEQIWPEEQQVPESWEQV